MSTIEILLDTPPSKQGFFRSPSAVLKCLDQIGLRWKISLNDKQEITTIFAYNDDVNYWLYFDSNRFTDGECLIYPTFMAFDCIDDLFAHMYKQLKG